MNALKLLQNKTEHIYVFPASTPSVTLDNLQNAIIEAMDEYAQQQALEFAGWLLKTGWRYDHNIKQWSKIENNEIEIVKTTEELYEIFKT